jgi:hypothetical protein
MQCILLHLCLNYFFCFMEKTADTPQNLADVDFERELATSKDMRALSSGLRALLNKSIRESSLQVTKNTCSGLHEHIHDR